LRWTRERMKSLAWAMIGKEPKALLESDIRTLKSMKLQQALLMNVCLKMTVLWN
jgi:hypothetical protein